MIPDRKIRYQKLKQLYDSFGSLPEEARAIYLEELEKKDPVLKAELLDLMEAKWPNLLKAQSVAEFLPTGIDHSLLLPTPGELIDGRYRIRESIGGGATSTVLLGWDEKLGRNPVALKFFHRASRLVNASLEREIAALARISHSGVSGMVDAGQWRGEFNYLVQQYWEGKTLRERLAEGPLEKSLALDILEETAEILEAAHQAGVLHLDLKPENIILTKDKRVRVVDFGAAQFGAQTQGGIVGTPGYQAPEQLEGKPSAKSDVFALARIAGELLDSEHPELRKVLSRGLAVNEAERLARPREFTAAIRVALRPSPYKKYALAGLFIAAALVSLFWMLRWENRSSKLLTFRQFTTQRGVEFNPDFSPDGVWIYFLQAENPRSPRRIMRKSLSDGAEEVVRAEQAHYSNLRLSPDNRWLAFVLRDGDLPELWIREIATGKESSKYRGYLDSLCFGPDSAWMILSVADEIEQRARLARLDLRSGQMEEFPHLNRERSYSGEVDISPDGRKLVFKRRVSKLADELLWVGLDAQGRPLGQPQMLVAAENLLYTPRWDPSGRSIYFMQGDLRRRSLWRTDLRGKRRQIPEAGETMVELAVSWRSSRLAVVRETEDSDLWKVRLPQPPVHRGGVLERVYPSTALDEEPRYSPDGTQIAFISERSGQQQLWVADQITGTLRQVTISARATRGGTYWLKNKGPVMFARTDSNLPFISEVRGAGGLFHVAEGTRVAGTSRDGNWLYINSEDAERQHLERVEIEGGRRESIGRFPAAVVKEANNGRSLYWTKRSAAAGLFHWESGKEHQKVVPRLVRRNLFGLARDWLYFVAQEPEMGVYAQHLKNGKIVQVVKLDQMPGWGLDIAPDGKELVLSLLDYSNSDIYIEQP